MFKEFIYIGSMLWDESELKWSLYHSFNSGELLRGKVVSMEFGWMLKCFFSLYRDLVIGDLEHA